MNDKKILIPFILITAVTFILNMTTQMTLPTFSVYLKHLEFPVGLIGAASLGIALAAMFFRPVSAILSRKMGSINTGLVGTSLYILAFTSFLIFKQPIMVVFARIIQGFGMGLVVTTLGALIAQIVPHDELLKGMNIYSLFSAAAGALGPYIGMFLIADGYFPRLFATALATVLLGTVILAYLRYRVHLPLPKDLHTQSSGTPIWKSRAVFPTLLAFTTSFVYAGIASYLSLYGIEVGIPNVGFFFLYGFIGLLASRLVVNRIMVNMHLSVILMIFGSAYAVILLMMMVFPSVIAWTFLGVAFGFVFNFIGTILNTMAVKNVPITDKTSANAMLFIGLDSGFFLGGLIWGQVADIFSTQTIFLVAAAVIFTAMMSGALIVKQRNIQF